MSGATAATVAAVVGATAAVAGTGAAYMQGQKQASARKKAASQAEANANKLYAQQDQELNRKNAKQPNTAALFAGNQQSAQAGASGTILTGPSGVDPMSLSLGKNTLIGGA